MGAVNCPACGSWQNVGECCNVIPRSEYTEMVQKIDDLAMLVRRLAKRVEIRNPTLAEQAMDYLKRKGLQGSPLRSTEE
jgi:hypothetical protein